MSHVTHVVRDVTHIDVSSLAQVLLSDWLQCVGALKLEVSFAKEPYKRDDILQKRPIIFSVPIRLAGAIAAPLLCTSMIDINESCHTCEWIMSHI